MKSFLERVQFRCSREEKANGVKKAKKKGLKLSSLLRSYMRSDD
jgi:hypothetical protein